MGKMILNGKEYAGSGSEWHEYSTAEKVVGKWIDGKLIYEKTFTNLSVSISGTSWVDINSINTTGWGIVIRGFAHRGDNYKIYTNDIVEMLAENGVLRIRRTYSATAITINLITVQYTKTTD